VPNRVDSNISGLLSRTIASAVPLAWGVALCAGVTLAAVTIQAVEERLTGHPYVEAVVIAILLGTAIRTIWEPGQRWQAGIAFSAKQLLEIAVALLTGSSVEGEATLKRIYREGARVRLQPANATMDPIYVDPRDLRIQGKVVSVIRSVE